MSNKIEEVVTKIGEEIIEDGKGVRVPLHLMDHKPSDNGSQNNKPTDKQVNEAFKLALERAEDPTGQKRWEQSLSEKWKVVKTPGVRDEN